MEVLEELFPGKWLDAVEMVRRIAKEFPGASSRNRKVSTKAWWLEEEV